jgi:hypothetical protein
MEDLYQSLLQEKAPSMCWEAKRGYRKDVLTGNKSLPYRGPGLVLLGEDAHGYRVKIELADNRSDSQRENFSVLNLALKEDPTSEFCTNSYRRLSNEEKNQLTKGISEILPSLRTVLPAANRVWNRFIGSILKIR